MFGRKRSSGKPKGVPNGWVKKEDHGDRVVYGPPDGDKKSQEKVHKSNANVQAALESMSQIMHQTLPEARMIDKENKSKNYADMIGAVASSPQALPDDLTQSNSANVNGGVNDDTIRPLLESIADANDFQPQFSVDNEEKAKSNMSSAVECLIETSVKQLCALLKMAGIDPVQFVEKYYNLSEAGVGNGGGTLPPPPFSI